MCCNWHFSLQLLDLWFKYANDCHNGCRSVCYRAQIHWHEFPKRDMRRYFLELEVWLLHCRFSYFRCRHIQQRSSHFIYRCHCWAKIQRDRWLSLCQIWYSSSRLESTFRHSYYKRTCLFVCRWPHPISHRKWTNEWCHTWQIRGSYLWKTMCWEDYWLYIHCVFL